VLAMGVFRLCLVAAMVSLLSLAAGAAEPRTKDEIKRLLRSSYTTIDGKKTPELVPYHIRMQHFFLRYKHASAGLQAEMKQLLSSEDETVLSIYADRHVEELKRDEMTYEKAWMDLASRAHGMDGISIASAIQTLTSELERSTDARYRTVLAKLSPAGQKAVNEFAFARIRPVIAAEDPIALATAAPEFYKGQIVAAYQMAQSGKQPPALEATIKSTRPSSKSMITEGSESGQLGSVPVPP